MLGDISLRLPFHFEQEINIHNLVSSPPPTPTMLMNKNECIHMKSTCNNAQHRTGEEAGDYFDERLQQECKPRNEQARVKKQKQIKKNQVSLTQLSRT